MGKATNAQKAAQVRQRRVRKKKELKNLYQLSISEEATEGIKSAYLKARQLTESSLKKERSRIQKYRNDLKKRAANKDSLALKKKQRTKVKKHIQYVKNKELGKRKQ